MRLELPDGETLGFDDLGDGDVLVLAHGFPFDRRMWDKQRPLARGTRLITLDFRGFGDSTGTGTVEDAADDIATLLDHLGVERAVVGGLSMGGYVALAFARRHAARLAGLVLADTRASADDEAARAVRDEAITRVVQNGVDRFVSDFVPKLVTGRDPAILDRLLGIAAIQTDVAVASALSALRDRPDATAGLADIAVPTTVLVGAEDALTPPAVARAMADKIRGATLVEIPRAAHLPPLEAPAAFNAAVDALLYRVRG